MNIKTIVFYLFILTIILSCLDLRTCNKSVVGKYVCYNNSKAENYLILRENGTFIHYYKEGETELKDEGTWVKSKKGHCIIEFSNWKTFNEDGLRYEELMNGLLWISYEYLDNGPDGDTNSSFLKSIEK